MNTTNSKKPTFFDNSFKEHPIFSFLVAFSIGILGFIAVYVGAWYLNQDPRVSAKVDAVPLSTLVGAMLTTVVALAGAVVTVVLARLGLKLGENAQESSVALHSFEYRSAARQELIPSINAIRALGDATVSFIASSGPLLLAMKRHMQIRGMSEGTQAGPADPVDFLSYRFDRHAHKSELAYFLEKANLLKVAIDEVLRHQIAITSIDGSRSDGVDLIWPKLQSSMGERIITDGNNPLDRLHLVRDYLENNLRAAPSTEKIGWAVLAGETASNWLEKTERNQASTIAQNCAFAGWLLARYPLEGSFEVNDCISNFGFAALIDMLAMLPTRGSVLHAAAQSHAGDDIYHDIVLSIARTMPLLPREDNSKIQSSAVARFLEAVPHDTKCFKIERLNTMATVDAMTSRESFGMIFNELMKEQAVAVDEIDFAMRNEDYDLWMHGSLMRFKSMPPTIRWLETDHLEPIVGLLIESFMFFFVAHGRSMATDVALLEAMASTALTFGSVVEGRSHDIDGDEGAKALSRFSRFFATICNYSSLKRQGGLSDQGAAEIAKRIGEQMDSEPDGERRKLMGQLFEQSNSTKDGV
jgi:hypothetical protein